MRALNKYSLAMLPALVAAGLGACKWTEFDDLSKEAWVDSTTKPGDIKSADYGLAVARATKDSADGGRLVVIGSNPASYSELLYSNQGESSLPATKIDLEMQYGISNLTQEPLLITNPSSDDVSLIVASDNGIAMLTGSAGNLKLYQFFNLAAPDAGTYMKSATGPDTRPIIAVGDSVYGGFVPALATGQAQPACKLGDAATPGFSAKIHALGAAHATGTTDDLLAWDATGKLYRYPSTVFDGCATAQPISSLDTGFQPDAGSRIVQVPQDPTHVILQGQSATSGFLLEVDLATMTAVGTGVTVAGLTSAAVLQVGAASYVVAGVPSASVSGTVTGQVQLFPLTAAGIASTSVAAYNDAQPDSNEVFGRGVAVMQFNGHPVIAAGANNEVFVYFRANLADGTALYDETRQGQ